MKVMKNTTIALLLIMVAMSTITCSKPKINYGDAKTYRFTQINRGTISTIVSSTGTVTAKDAVTVGTEVSGTVDTVCVDFNDKVSKGQILARLKPDLLKAAIRDAEANLIRLKAQYNQALTEYNQNLPLFEKGFLSSKEFLPIKTNVETTKATLQSGQASLDRAKTNLSYSFIRSPIDGVILERNIEAGQTVAASFSTPTLFVIASDLSKMEIEALVDESDISSIKDSMRAEFTVAAYPDKTFDGVVSQIRRKPVTVQNVVNYTVVLQAQNEHNELLPGMTATIEFLIARASNVLTITNDALRFKPDSAMIGFFRRSSHKDMPQKQDFRRDHRTMSRDSLTQQSPLLERFQKSNGLVTLWYLDSNRLSSVKVHTGLSDGTTTQIKDTMLVHENQKIIKSFANIENKAGASQSMGSQRNGQRNSQRPPRMFF